MVVTSINYRLGALGYLALPSLGRFTQNGQQIQELIPAATAPESAATFAAYHQCAFWVTLGA